MHRGGTYPLLIVLKFARLPPTVPLCLLLQTPIQTEYSPDQIAKAKTPQQPKTRRQSQNWIDSLSVAQHSP
jgi:hypothetical protein